MQIPADAPLQAPAIPDISTVDVPTYTAPGPQPSSASVPGEFLYTFRLWGQQVTASSAHISNLEALAQPLEACPLPSSANLADALPPLHPWMSGSLLSGVATSDTAYSAVEELAADISYLTDPDPAARFAYEPRPLIDQQAWPWPPFQPIIGAENALLPHASLAANYAIDPHPMLDYQYRLVQTTGPYPLTTDEQPTVPLVGSLLSPTSTPLSENPLALDHLPSLSSLSPLSPLPSLPVVLAPDQADRSAFMPTPDPPFFPGMELGPTASFSATQQLLQRPRRGYSTSSLTSDAFLMPQPMPAAYASMPYDAQPPGGLPPPPPLYPTASSTMPAASLSMAHQHKPRVQSLPNVPMADLPPQQQPTATEAAPPVKEPEKTPEAKDQPHDHRQDEPLRWYQRQLFQQLQHRSLADPSVPKETQTAEDPQCTSDPATPSPRVLSQSKQQQQQQQQKPRTKSADGGKQGGGNPSQSQKWPLGRPKKRRSLDLEAESAMRSATGVFPATAPSTTLEPVFIAFDPQSLSPARSPKSTAVIMPASTTHTSHAASLDGDVETAEKTDRKAVRPRKRSKVGDGVSSSPVKSPPTSPLAAIAMSCPRTGMGPQPDRRKLQVKRDTKVAKSYAKKAQNAKKQSVADPLQAVGVSVRA